MQKMSLVYHNRVTGRARRMEFEGQEVSYEAADEILGEDFVTFRADEEVFVIPRESLIYLNIKR